MIVSASLPRRTQWSSKPLQCQYKTTAQETLQLLSNCADSKRSLAVGRCLKSAQVEHGAGVAYVIAIAWQRCQLICPQHHMDATDRHLCTSMYHPALQTDNTFPRRTLVRHVTALQQRVEMPSFAPTLSSRPWQLRRRPHPHKQLPWHTGTGMPCLTTRMQSSNCSPEDHWRLVRAAV